MSFVNLLGSSNSVWDLYPDGIARLVAEPDTSALESWQQLPECYKDICEHICTVANLSSLDITHQHKVAYSTTGNEGWAKLKMFYCFSLRLQLFLGRHNLKPLGNWDGSVLSRSSTWGSYAQQTQKEGICLQICDVPDASAADGYHDQYDVQSTAMSNICKYVLHTVGVAIPSDVMEIPNELFLQCHVFTRVAGLANKLASVLAKEDDPKGRAISVADTWRVVQKESFMMCTSNGQVKRCSLFVFGVGNLIDVNVDVDVTTYKGAGGVRTTKVHFAFDRLVQLCPASSVKNLLGAAPPLNAGPSMMWQDDDDFYLEVEADVEHASDSEVPEEEVTSRNDNHEGTPMAGIMKEDVELVEEDGQASTMEGNSQTPGISASTAAEEGKDTGYVAVHKEGAHDDKQD